MVLLIFSSVRSRRFTDRQSARGLPWFRVRVRIPVEADQHSGVIPMTFVARQDSD
jgi:hypothetical protein